MIGLMKLIAGQATYKVTNWDDNNYGAEERVSDEKRVPAPLDRANVVSSAKEYPREHNDLDDLFDLSGPYHKVLLDIDRPAWLIPSTTEGHFHLYIDVDVPEGDYFELLRVLAKCGVIEYGYAESSIKKGGSALRLPWIKKEAGQ